jgi:hypothetical protein
MEGLEENEALQEADYMTESESEVREADMEIEAHVCNFYRHIVHIFMSRQKACCSNSNSVLFAWKPFRQKKRCSNSNSMLSV